MPYVVNEDVCHVSKCRGIDMKGPTKWTAHSGWAGRGGEGGGPDWGDGLEGFKSNSFPRIERKQNWIKIKRMRWICLHW